MRYANEREWFRLWIAEGYSARQLADQSGHSPAKLYRIINYHLPQPAPLMLNDLRQCRHLILDGTYLHRPQTLIALMDGERNNVICGRYPVSESSEGQLTAFLGPLKNKGLRPRSFTVDGNPNVTRVLRKLWPGVRVQRCLIHIQRQGLSWCRTSPKTTYARKLRQLFRRVAKIRTSVDRDRFLQGVRQWEQAYFSLMQRPEAGKVFSDIKRAWSMLRRALPDMFHYLDDPGIPISTNALEGYFSRLKDHYRRHRGLNPKKRNNYFQWYFYFSQKSHKND